MRFTCTKYPELHLAGKDYRVRFEGGVADVEDTKTVAAMKKYVESDAGQAHGIAAEQPKAAKAAPKAKQGGE